MTDGEAGSELSSFLQANAEDTKAKLEAQGREKDEQDAPTREWARQLIELATNKDLLAHMKANGIADVEVARIKSEEETPSYGDPRWSETSIKLTEHGEITLEEELWIKRNDKPQNTNNGGAPITYGVVDTSVYPRSLTDNSKALMSDNLTLGIVEKKTVDGEVSLRTPIKAIRTFPPIDTPLEQKVAAQIIVKTK